MKTDLIKEAVTDWWGERCTEYDPDCVCCTAWAQFDKLKKKAKKGKQQ